MLSQDERYEEDIEQTQYMLKWAERKEDKKRTRKKYLDEFKEVFKESTKN